MKSAQPNLEVMAPAESRAVEHTQPQSHAASMVEVIARAAADPNTDVAKMERLYAMLKEENARIAEQRFNAAMSQAQAEMPMIIKTARNPSTNSAYAKLEVMAKAIAPVIEKYKFSLKFSEGDCPNPAKIRVLCKISHDAGEGLSHSEVHHLDLSPDDTGAKGAPSKTKIHGEGSTFSYGRRYLLSMIFNLTVVGMDDDGNQGHKPRPAGPSSAAAGPKAAPEAKNAPKTPPDDAKATKTRLWNLLKPIVSQNPDWNPSNWNAHNEWLRGAKIITKPETKVETLPVEDLREIIDKAQVVLSEM